MKKNFKIARVIVSVTIALLVVSIGLSTASGLLDKTVKANGKLYNPFFYFDAPYAKPRVGNTIMLEIKAKWVGGSLVGSGSLHGINCHSTFFFDDLTGTVEDDILTLSGTVTGTSTPFAGWTGTDIELVTDLSGNDMHLHIYVPFEEVLIDLDFAGSGKVVW